MFTNCNQIITGEKIQGIADVYIGTAYYFNYNPSIVRQTNKHKYLSEFDNNIMYDNPRVVFCYGDLIDDFEKNIHLFSNPFILITHNSDKNIIKCNTVDNILNFDKLIRWHAQNVGYVHEKLYSIPIGIANQQWPHGNLKIYQYIIENYDIKTIKNKRIFMNFKIETNIEKRMKCYEELHRYIPFLPVETAYGNITRMIEYKFCICPEGNGFDTHRMWECFYLRIVPIVLRSKFTENIQKTFGLPMIIVDFWKDVKQVILNYDSFDFKDCDEKLTFNYYVKQIIS